MLESIIRMFFFRDLFTDKEKWFIAVFSILVGVVCLAGYAVLACLKLFVAFMRMLNGNE